LLLAELDGPVVATSGNVSDEPICTDEGEALERLGGIADGFLVHDRPIARHVDDSVARVVAGREQVMRRARGYAPLPLRVSGARGRALAVGAHLKNAVALSIDEQAFVSQHVGDLDAGPAYRAFEDVIASLARLYQATPESVICDAHPDYLSTRYAAARGVPVRRVQHHVAHVLACMAENELEPPVLGVSWDGTGYGADGTVWGGEFLRVTRDAARRVAHLRTFTLPGGEQAVREPRRAALGLWFEMTGESDAPPPLSFSTEERRVIARMLRAGINSPRTSSAGRLFDAVAALLGGRQINHFEGQAAMELEFLIDDAAATVGAGPYAIALRDGAGGAPMVLDWEPLVRAMRDDLSGGTSVAAVARAFHDALAAAVAAVAERTGEGNVVLSGGCFQNRYLTEETIRRLRAGGFRPYWHQRVPPNDGGIALGQIAAAARGYLFAPGDS
jgi:hydrogenase maturation protein HypF